MRHRRWVLLSLLMFAGGGCRQVDELKEAILGKDAETADSAGDSAKPDAKEEVRGGAPTECGADTFPCTWGEVSVEAQAHVRTLATDAIQAAMKADSADALAAAVEVIEGDDDASVMSAHGHTVRFLVDGARPAWVFVDTRQTVNTLAPAALPWMGPAPAAGPTPPVGQALPGTKPKKKVLILSPFMWQWQISGDTDETDRIAELFESVRDYEGGVTLLSNRLAGSQIDYEVGLENFANWGEYDVIHVSTHGTSCPGESLACNTALATGDVWTNMGEPLDKQDKDLLRSEGIDIGFIPLHASSTPVVDGLDDVGLKLRINTKAAMAGSTLWIAGPFVLVNTRFFEWAYRDKLDDKIIFLSACRSAQKSDLSTALAGSGTAVIGWDKVMDLFLASESAKAFWAKMIGAESGSIAAQPDGATVEEAFKLLDGLEEAAVKTGSGPMKSIVVEDGAVVDSTTSARLEPSGATNTRAREIVGLVVEDDGKARPLQDGDSLDLVGIPGDGKPDTLRLTFEVSGIGGHDDPAKYELHLDVDGKTVKQTFKPEREVTEGRWRVDAEVKLGFDLSVGKPITLEPWVKMPTGGTSRWRYENLAPEYLVVHVSGPAFPTEQTFSIDPEQVKLNVFSNSIILRFMDRGLAAVTGVGDRLRGGVQGSRRGLSADGSRADLFILQAQGSGPGEYTIGSNGELSLGLHSAGGSPENCPEYAGGCHSIGLDDKSGTIVIQAVTERTSDWRQGTKTPASVRGTFEVEVQRTNHNHSDETYEVHGSFRIID